MNKIKAFTLAEVLITLGIIGVTAALTLPSLTQKYQDKILEQQFKKSYSTLSNALNTVNQENGMTYLCYSDLKNKNTAYSINECDAFWEQFLNKIKIVQTCKNTDNCYSSQPVYKNKSEVIAEGGKISEGSCAIPLNGTVYTLADGTIIKRYSGHDTYFYVDVNGIKKPNKWGYDVFVLTFDKHNTSQVRITDSICALQEKGGKQARNILIGDDKRYYSFED